MASYAEKGHELSYDAAREEVIADSLENMLDEPDVLKKLAKKEKNLFKRLWQAIMDFFDRLTGKLYKYQHSESRLVAEATREEQKRLNKLFIDALQSANEGAKALNSGKAEGKTEGAEVSGEAKYSIKYPTFSEAEISSNMDTIADMDAVATIDASKLEKTGKSPRTMFEEFFASVGNSIYSDVYGDISLGKSSVKSEIRHGITAEKIASIEAIPSVIEQGKVIFHKTKEGGVERIVICAPIKIGEADYYMGVMLQRDAQTQYLYLHNVAIEKEAQITSETHLLTTGVTESDSRLFITSILQKSY